MSFAIPIFLGAAAFIAVPIIIHMIERQRFQQIELPTVQFVTRTEKRNIIRLRLIDILLLLLRVLIVALIVLAFANPLLPSGTFGMPLPTDAQIIVDDSTSMARLAPDGQKLIDKAKEAAISILESLPEGGNVSVVAMSGMLTPSFSLDRSKARASLDAIELTPSPSRAVEMALQGVSLIGSGGSGTGEDKARRKEIYFITDLCRNSFGQDLQDLANVVKSSTDDGLFGALNIYIIDVGEASTANVAIRGVRVTRSRISLEMPLKVAVEVVNYGTKAVKDVSVEMRIDDKPIGKIGDKAAKLSLAPGEMRMLEFPYTPYKNGVLTGEAWITAKEENAVDWDDHYWFCLEIREQVSVLCIDGDESGDHGESNAFRRALTAASAGSGQPFYSTRSVRSSKAADEVLAFYDVVALVNPGIIPPETIKAAVEFVEDGGGLLIFLGDLIRAESFQSLANAVLPESEKEEKFLPITMGETIDARQLTKAAVKLQQCDFNSPLFSVFRDPAAGDPTVLAAFKYRRLVFAEDAPIKVLASFSNGAPAIVEREFGMGKIIVVATTPNREWSNFPTKAVFVPFARAMVRAAQRSRLGSTPRYRFAGQVFQIVTKADRFAEDSDMVMLIKNPDDEELPSKEIPGDVQNRRLGRAGAKAGIYKLVLEPRKKPEKTDKKLVTKPLDAFVVVLPASESVLKRLDSQSIKESFGDNADAVHIVEMKEGWVESIESERKGRQLGWYAFAALLCLLTLEGLIAWLKKTTGGS